MNKAEKRARGSAPRPRAIAQVRCGGKMHSIQLVDGAGAALLDHTPEQIVALRTLKKMGDTTCRCLTVVDLLKNGEWLNKHFAKEVDLKPVLDFARGRHSVRRRKGEFIAPEPGRFTTHRDWEGRALMHAARRQHLEDLQKAATALLGEEVAVTNRSTLSPSGPSRHGALVAPLVMWGRIKSLGLASVAGVVGVEVWQVARFGERGQRVEYLGVVRRVVGDVVPVNLMVGVKAVATRRDPSATWEVRLATPSGTTVPPDSMLHAAVACPSQ